MLERVTVKGRKVQVDVRGELDKYEFERATITEEKITCCSPFRTDDNNPSFFIRLVATEEYDSGLWTDSGYDDERFRSGNFVQLLSHLRGESHEETEQYLLEEYDSEYDGSKPMKLRMPQLRMKKQREYFSEDILMGYDDYSDYLRGRGISDLVQERMKTKYDRERKQVVIPWFDAQDRLATVKYRSTESKRFYYIKGGIPVRQLVYGMNIVNKLKSTYVVVVEGEIDALTLLSMGVPAVALGGASLSEQKKEIFLQSYVEKVIIMTDNDTSGREIRKMLAGALGNHMEIYHAYVPNPFKDVNDMRQNPTAIKAAIRNSEKESKKILKKYKKS